MFGGYTPGYAGTPSWVTGASLYRSMNFLNAIVGANAGGLGPSFLAGAAEWLYRGGMLGVNPNDQFQYGVGETNYAARAANANLGTGAGRFWGNYFAGEASAYGAMNSIAPLEAAWYGAQASTYFWNNQTLGAGVRLYGWIMAGVGQQLAVGRASSQYVGAMYQQYPNVTEQMLLGQSYLGMAYGYQDPLTGFGSNTLNWGLGYGVLAQLRYGNLNPLAMMGVTFTLGGASMLAEAGATMYNRSQIPGMPLVPSGEGGNRFYEDVFLGGAQLAGGIGLSLYSGRGVLGLGGQYGRAINTGVDYGARGAGMLTGLAAYAGFEYARPYAIQAMTTPRTRFGRPVTGITTGEAQGLYSMGEAGGVMTAQYLGAQFGPALLTRLAAYSPDIADWITGTSLTLQGLGEITTPAAYVMGLMDVLGYGASQYQAQTPQISAAYQQSIAPGSRGSRIADPNSPAMQAASGFWGWFNQFNPLVGGNEQPLQVGRYSPQQYGQLTTGYGGFQGSDMPLNRTLLGRASATGITGFYPGVLQPQWPASFNRGYTGFAQGQGYRLNQSSLSSMRLMGEGPWYGPDYYLHRGMVNFLTGSLDYFPQPSLPPWETTESELSGFAGLSSQYANAAYLGASGYARYQEWVTLGKPVPATDFFFDPTNTKGWSYDPDQRKWVQKDYPGGRWLAYDPTKGPGLQDYSNPNAPGGKGFSPGSNNLRVGSFDPYSGQYWNMNTQGYWFLQRTNPNPTQSPTVVPPSTHPVVPPEHDKDTREGGSRIPARVYSGMGGFHGGGHGIDVSYEAGPHSTKELAPAQLDSRNQTQSAVYRIIRRLIEQRVLLGTGNWDYLTANSVVNKIKTPLSGWLFDEASK